MESRNEADLTALKGRKVAKAKAGRARATTTRAADYAIQGFLYQFNKTLLAILESDDEASIVIEGVIEDIDIHGPFQTTAIQCKYHESHEIFTLSVIYKPVLQMLDEFHRNPKANIGYRLFAHFPNQVDGDHFPITRAHIEKILTTTTVRLTANELSGSI